MAESTGYAKVLFLPFCLTSFLIFPSTKETLTRKQTDTHIALWSINFSKNYGICYSQKNSEVISGVAILCIEFENVLGSVGRV